jgi:predicted permease
LGQRTSTLAPVADLLQDGPLESVCAYVNNSVGVVAHGIPAYATVEIVTHQCFATIGVPPLLGRVFTADEAPASRPGRRVVVIGYDFWQKMFGGAPDVVGRSFHTDLEPVTVIGVMARGFRGLRVDDGVDIIAPFGTLFPPSATRPPLANSILGRLRPGVTLEAARAELAARWPSMMDRVIPTALSPAEQRNFRDVTIRVERMGTGFSLLRTRYEQPLWIGSALTLGLLLLACVNVGGLALSRVVARGGELAMRTALGASRLRLARQLVLEILAVAGAGTILGIGVAWIAVMPIAAALPFGGLQPTLSITPDGRVVFVTALAGLVTGLLASLLPVWLASRRETLQLHTDRTVAATSRPGRALLVVQVALSVALLMGAGVLTRSLYLLFHNHPGFDGTTILSARLRPLPGAYRDPAFNNGLNYYPVLLERLAALPGVRSVGYARAFGNADRDDVGRSPIGFVGTPPSDLTAQLDVVSPGFFETIGIPIL